MTFYRPFTWAQYSKKLTKKILKPRAIGIFSNKSGMFLAQGKEGSFDEGNAVLLSLLVDESDGVIADARFQVFGESALVGAAEVLCELVLRKNYDQARRITADLIDAEVRDASTKAGFSKEAASHINLVLSALDEALDKCLHIPLVEGYVVTPLATHLEGEGPKYPEFFSFSKEQQVALLKEVLDNDVRPYVELDAGGVDVIDIKDREVVIGYSGSCTTCYAATGSTLGAIEQILKAKVHEDITVIPDMSTLMPDGVSH